MTLWLPHAMAQQTQPASEPPSTQPTTTPSVKAVEYAPGITIDWAERQVEATGRVVLQEGLIELFACSPDTREYESIVRMDGRPLHLFEALGLIGLTPGEPMWYDWERDQPVSAHGQPVEIMVAYERDGETRRSDISQWLVRRGEADPLEPQPWVFAGSYVDRDRDVFAADEEGTVVALVDFPSALIALPMLRSSRNEELWLEPRTSAIPEPGTRCRLIFRPGPITIHLDRHGRASVAGRRVGFGEMARTLRVYFQGLSRPRVKLEMAHACPADSRETVLRLLDLLGVPPESIERSEFEDPAHKPKKLASRPAIGPSTRPSTQPAGQGDDDVGEWLDYLIERREKLLSESREVVRPAAQPERGWIHRAKRMVARAAAPIRHIEPLADELRGALASLGHEAATQPADDTPMHPSDR
jgi:hypothetical protein